MSGRVKVGKSTRKSTEAVLDNKLPSHVADEVNNPEVSSPVSRTEVEQTNLVAPSSADMEENELNLYRFGEDEALSYVSKTDSAFEQTDLGVASPAAEPKELNTIFQSPTSSPDPEQDDAFNEIASQEALGEESEIDLTESSPLQAANPDYVAASEEKQDTEIAYSGIYVANKGSPFRQALKLEPTKRESRATGSGRRLSAFPIMQTLNDQTEQQSNAIVQIRSMMNLGEGHINVAMQNIAICLTKAIQRGDLNWSNSDRKTVTDNLRTLQFTSKSLFNTAINAVIATVLCCSLVGVVGLWLTGAFDKKKTVNGSAFAFFAFGEKQHVEKTIHQAELILQAPAPAMS